MHYFKKVVKYFDKLLTNTASPPELDGSPPFPPRSAGSPPSPSFVAIACISSHKAHIMHACMHEMI